MGDVVTFHGLSKLDVPVQKVIAAADNAELQTAVVVGFTQDGEFYFASSAADGGEVLWLLKLAERRLFEKAEELSDG